MQRTHAGKQSYKKKTIFLKFFFFSFFLNLFFFFLKICPCIFSLFFKSPLFHCSVFLLPPFQELLIYLFLFFLLVSLFPPFLWVGSSCSVAGFFPPFHFFSNSQVQFCCFFVWFLNCSSVISPAHLSKYIDIYIFLLLCTFVLPYCFFFFFTGSTIVLEDKFPWWWRT